MMVSHRTEPMLDIEESSDSTAKERIITVAALLVVAFLTLLDLIEDHAEGAGWPHLITESAVMLASTLAAVYLSGRALRHYRRQSRALQGSLLAARDDAQRWRSEASGILAGLGEAIERQFRDWHLSSAEKDVALLLLKGLSHKEIANVRDTSEKTVRQQAASMYAKASLDGRAQLSAFFLEELLLPLHSKVSKSA